MELAGKKALITGGGGGIGRATALALQAAGAEVHITQRRAVAAPPGITAHLCDMREGERLAALIAAERFDILINNAAVIAPIGPLAEVAPAEWEAALAINLTGAFRAAQALIAAHEGALAGVTLIHISSGAAHRPVADWGAYCVSKAGLAMLTRMLALEYGGAGLRVFGLAPGVVDTGMQAAVRAAGLGPTAHLAPGDLARPEGPAAAIRFLCSPAADGFIGQELDIRAPEFRAAAGLPPLP